MRVIIVPDRPAKQHPWWREALGYCIGALLVGVLLGGLIVPSSMR